MCDTQSMKSECGRNLVRDNDLVVQAEFPLCEQELAPVTEGKLLLNWQRNKKTYAFLKDNW